MAKWLDCDMRELILGTVFRLARSRVDLQQQYFQTHGMAYDQQLLLALRVRR